MISIPLVNLAMWVVADDLIHGDGPQLTPFTVNLYDWRLAELCRKDELPLTQLPTLAEARSVGHHQVDVREAELVCMVGEFKRPRGLSCLS